MYQSINSVHDFEFHDSEWAFISNEASSLTIRVEKLNLHRDAPQNPIDCDMEIESACITLEKVQFLSHAPSVPWKKDASGKSHPLAPLITYTGEDAAERFIHECKCGVTVYKFQAKCDGQYEIHAMGEDPYFETVFAAENVRIEWDMILRPAWYVLKNRESLSARAAYQLENANFLVVPRNKYDIDAVRWLEDELPDRVIPILPELMEWLQDANCPVAQAIVPLLIKYETKTTQIAEDILKADQTDEIWKYWIISMFVPALSTENQRALHPSLRRIAYNPTNSEQLEEVDEVAREYLNQNP